MDTILVTVYVITYKRFDTIYRNLGSILNQTYDNIELIVSDDGSPDFPKADIETYLNANRRSNIKSFRVIANPLNVGTVKHINKVLAMAHGELFVPLSGDDEFYNNDVISLIVDVYQKKHFNVLSTSRVAVDDEGNQLYYIPHILDRIVIKLWIRTARQQLNRLIQNRFHNFASGSVLTIRADFFREMGKHDERYFLWEDGPFIAKVTSMGYKIDTCYEIISIKYKLGGISTGGTKGLTKKYMDHDGLLFRNEARKYSVNFRTRRIMQWEETYPDIKNNHLPIWFRVKYFDIFLLKKYDYIIDVVCRKYDKWKLNG